MSADKTVALQKCATPLAANQKWAYDAVTQQLTTGDGLCVTAGGHAPGPSVKSDTMILGRPLAHEAAVADCFCVWGGGQAGSEGHGWIWVWVQKPGL